MKTFEPLVFETYNPSPKYIMKTPFVYINLFHRCRSDCCCGTHTKCQVTSDRDKHAAANGSDGATCCPCGHTI